MVNILIINYNTSQLLNACINSINKFTTNSNIYVFDNSDCEPFKNTYENVSIIDNTKGNIINFNDFLDQFQNKTKYGAESNYGTLKHTLSVDKCFDIINDNFILIDSDVLLKKDISELFDEKYIYVGDVNTYGGKSKNKRVSPHICFINVKKAKENNIRYFDKNRIVGLSNDGDDYDTGSSFYFDCCGLESKNINEKEYIEHYGAASWINLTTLKKITPIDWINKFKYLWTNNDINNLDIFICTHKDFNKIVNNPIYKVIDARKIDKTKYVLGDDFWSELLQYFYVADNCTLKDYVGFCHYRRYYSFMNDVPDMKLIFKDYDCVTAKIRESNINMREEYKKFHNIEDLNIIESIIENKYKDYSSAFRTFLYGKKMFQCNMFIMKKEDFLEYISFIKNVMGEYLKIVGTNIVKRIEDNKNRYLKSFYPNSTVDYQYRIGGYLAERLTNVFILKKFKNIKTYQMKITETKYKKPTSESKVDETTN